MGIGDGYTVLDNSPNPPTVNVSGGAVSFNPFGSVKATHTTTVNTIIQGARTRHWSFSETKLPDGAALQNLRGFEREVLGLLANDIEGFVGTTMQYGVSDSALAGQLVLMFNGIPVLADPGQDGWPVQFDADGFPFVDITAPQIAGDPLQRRGTGGLQGFPLPAQFIRVIDAKLLWENGMYQRINVVPERDRLAALQGRDPVAFVSNNRFIPMLYTPTLETSNTAFNYSYNASRWGCLQAVQISYIALSDPRSLEDFMTLPDALVSVLIAKMTTFLALQNRDCSPADRRFFVEQEQRVMADIAQVAQGMMGPPPNESVEYH